MNDVEKITLQAFARPSVSKAELTSVVLERTACRAHCSDLIRDILMLRWKMSQCLWAFRRSEPITSLNFLMVNQPPRIGASFQVTPTRVVWWWTPQKDLHLGPLSVTGIVHDTKRSERKWTSSSVSTRKCFLILKRRRRNLHHFLLVEMYEWWRPEATTCDHTWYTGLLWNTWNCKPACSKVVACRAFTWGLIRIQNSLRLRHQILREMSLRLNCQVSSSLPGFQFQTSCQPISCIWAICNRLNQLCKLSGVHCIWYSAIGPSKMLYIKWFPMNFKALLTIFWYSFAC